MRAGDSPGIRHALTLALSLALALPLAVSCVRNNAGESVDGGADTSTADGGGDAAGGDVDGDSGVADDAGMDAGGADPCLGVDCASAGTCEVVEGQAVCDCAEGYVNSPDPADCGAPEIRVLFQGEEIFAEVDAGARDFGIEEVDGNGGLAGVYAAFTIANAGDGDLAIADVFLSGEGAADFDLDDTAAAVVAPGGETSFSVRFDPQSLGARDANVTISSSDMDESAFSFAVSGAGVDTTAPSLATGAIAFGDLDDTGFTVSWTKAIDLNTPAGELEYRVYRSREADLGDLEAMEGGDLVMDWTKDVSLFAESALEPDSVYYYNVAVRDAIGNMRAYTTAGEKTMAPLLLYEKVLDASVPRDREGFDGACLDALPDTISPDWNVKAFISFSSGDQIADFVYGPVPVPEHVQIRGTNDAEHVFAADWTTLFATGPAMTLAQAGVFGTVHSYFWLSGSHADGTVETGGTCNGWADTSTDKYIVGVSSTTESTWISSTSIVGCDGTAGTILCLAWE